MKSPGVRWVLAAALVVVLVLHANAEGPTQLLWACHLAAAMIVIGLVFDVPRLLAIGLVFHAGEGIPAFTIDLIASGDTNWRSLALHTLPIASAAWALWGRPLPRNILAPACALHVAAMTLAYLLADPKLNVMLVQEPFAPTASLFSSLWLSWLVSSAAAFACLTVAWVVVRAIWRRCS